MLCKYGYFHPSYTAELIILFMNTLADSNRICQQLPLLAFLPAALFENV